MKKLLTGLLLLCLVTGANAAIYDWSYVFGTGATIYGSFEGTASGATVTDINNIQINSSNAAWADFGPVNATCDLASSTCIASFSGSGMDINFISASGDFYFNIFSTALDSNPSASAFLYSTFPPLSVSESPLVLTGWTLTEQVTNIASVPESSSIYLLALGLFGIFGAVRRKV